MKTLVIIGALSLVFLNCSKKFPVIDRGRCESLDVCYMSRGDQREDSIMTINCDELLKLFRGKTLVIAGAVSQPYKIILGVDNKNVHKPGVYVHIQEYPGRSKRHIPVEDVNISLLDPKWGERILDFFL